jgi:hypothetical protein
VRDPLFTLDCPDPVARLAKLKITDPDRINVFDIFETWWRHHFDGWVTANQLNWDVQALLLHGSKFSRQRINYEVRELVGTRIGSYLLEEKKSQTSKWAAAEFRLIKTDSPRAREGYYNQQSETPTTPEAPAPKGAASEEAADDADGWHEPESGPQPTAHAAKEPEAPPDVFNAEGRLVVWHNAFAPLNSETEPCPGWRPGEWPRVYACIKQFLAGPYALAAARTGWSALDLFAVHKVVGVAARDCVGALTANTTNGFVARVEADGALHFANGTKARKRPLDSNLCIPVWSFRASTNAPR